MPRRTQRLIATLLVWIAILLTTGVIVSRAGLLEITSSIGGYWPSNVVTGGDAETVAGLLGRIQSINNEVWSQTQTMANELYTTYALWLVLMIGIILAGAVISTFFIWRSVYLSESQTPTEESIMQAGKRRLLEDDDESVNGDSLPAAKRRMN